MINIVKKKKIRVMVQKNFDGYLWFQTKCITVDLLQFIIKP